MAIAEDRVRSAIFFGPPGSGKTTLARIVAGDDRGGLRGALRASRRRSPTSAPCSPRARERLGAQGQRTILFLDEIHRFNKAQQDALLPAVEEGLVTLIGATTENPYFEVNSALLSRVQLYELQPLDEDLDLAAVDRRGPSRHSGSSCPDGSATLVARTAGGDARNALTHPRGRGADAGRRTPITEAHVEDAARKRPLLYDKGGDAHYDFTSAFIKSMRGSDPDAAVYYLAAMLEGGEDPRVHRPPDGDPRLRGHRQRRPAARSLVAVAAAQARRARRPAGGAAEPRAGGDLPRARARSRTRATSRSNEATQDVREHGNVRPPKELRDARYPGAKKLGHGAGYVYPHDDPAGFDVDYLPDELKGRTYYRPSGNGEEAGE